MLTILYNMQCVFFDVFFIFLFLKNQLFFLNLIFFSVIANYYNIFLSYFITIKYYPDIFKKH